MVLPATQKGLQYLLFLQCRWSWRAFHSGTPTSRHLGEPDPAAGPGATRPDLAASTLDVLCASPRARLLLWGMPGIGKTALARHVANLDHPQLGDAAGGGWRNVLWTTWGASCTGAVFLSLLCYMKWCDEAFSVLSTNTLTLCCAGAAVHVEDGTNPGAPAAACTNRHTTFQKPGRLGCWQGDAGGDG